jgi:hypothetical protein
MKPGTLTAYRVDHPFPQTIKGNVSKESANLARYNLSIFEVENCMMDLYLLQLLNMILSDSTIIRCHLEGQSVLIRLHQNLS